MASLEREWTSIVNSIHLEIDNDITPISAEQIKSITGLDPHRICRMNKEANLPTILSGNGLFVVPISRDGYVIVRGDGYHRLERTIAESDRFPTRCPIQRESRESKTTIDKCLCHALLCGIVEDFTGTHNLRNLPADEVRASFDFYIGSVGPVTTENCQLNVDLAIETEQDAVFIHAIPESNSEFLIVDLYYPYRIGREILGKNTRTLIFSVDIARGRYTLREYSWRNDGDHASVYNVRTKEYLIEEEAFELIDLLRVNPDPNLNIIPQADDIMKLAELPLLIDLGITTPTSWAEFSGMAERQGEYYFEAAEAMGLICRDNDDHKLTKIGADYLSLSQAERPWFLVERILTIPIMNEILRLARRRSVYGIRFDDIVRHIEKKSPLRGSTPNRRTRTIISYFRFIGETTGRILVIDERLYLVT